MQQDSQEILSLMLDDLHEDLNKVKKKLYVENKVIKDPDEAVVYSWKMHLSRNQSIIVDLMHGLFKSSIFCPLCKQTVVIGEPFCTISLPIPKNQTLYFLMYYVPYGTKELPIRFELNIAQSTNVKEIKQKIRQLIEIDEQTSIMGLAGYHLKRIFREETTVGEIKKDVEASSQTTHIMLYQQKPENVILPLMISFEDELTSEIKQISYVRILSVNKKISIAELYIEVIDYFWNYVVEIHSDIHKDSVSDPNELIKRLLLTSEKTKVEELLAPYFELFIINNKGELIPLEYSEQKLLADLNPTSLNIIWSRKSRILVSQSINKYEEHKGHIVEKNPELHITLNHCFKFFVSAETLDEDNSWYCSQCKTHVQCTKTTTIYKAPKILILALKRFKNFALGQKNKVFVEYPLTGFDISGYANIPIPKYNLYAVVNHYGNLGGGHYTAFTKNELNDKWYLFDDSNVKEVKEDELVSAAAYVLFYKRED